MLHQSNVLHTLLKVKIWTKRGGSAGKEQWESVGMKQKKRERLPTINVIITSRLTDPPIGRFSQSIGWFVWTSDPDVFMDLAGKVIVICAWGARHVSLRHFNCTDKNRCLLRVHVRARVDTSHLAPADACICCWTNPRRWQRGLLAGSCWNSYKHTRSWEVSNICLESKT